jgi:hypothetical protein
MPISRPPEDSPERDEDGILDYRAGRGGAPGSEYFPI